MQLNMCPRAPPTDTGTQLHLHASCRQACHCGNIYHTARGCSTPEKSHLSVIASLHVCNSLCAARLAMTRCSSLRLLLIFPVHLNVIRRLWRVITQLQAVTRSSSSAQVTRPSSWQGELLVAYCAATFGCPCKSNIMCIPDT